MEDRIRDYKGKNIIVSYSPRRCVHAGECTARLARVFDTSRRPWVKPDDADAQEIAEVVMRCPTGALHFTRLDGGGPEQIPDHNEITLVADGPLYLSGDIELIAPDGSLYLKDTRVALCRCGESKFNPFCDETHTQAGFKDAGQLCDPQIFLVPRSTQSANQALRVRFYPNDSYLIEGPFTLVGANGTQVEQAESGSFCSCGASTAKPFCDGSHMDHTS